MAVKINVFTSPTCPHCPSAVKAVDGIKDEVEGIIVEELSTATPKGQKLARKHNIMSVPTIIIEGVTQENIGFRGTPSKKSLLKAINIAKGIDQFEEKKGFFENLAEIIQDKFKVKIKL